jgi:hypothetical protein
MLRYMLSVSFAFAVFSVSAAAQDDFVEVTVTGQGLSEDGARRDALRRALEEGGKVELASRSQTENFQLIRDTIFARADGIITDYKIIEQGDAAGGVKYCKIVAKVSKSAIATTWGEVQNVLDQLGRPAIAVYIQESSRPGGARIRGRRVRTERGQDAGHCEGLRYADFHYRHGLRECCRGQRFIR